VFAKVPVNLYRRCCAVTKNDLVQEVAKATNVSKKAAAEAVEAVFKAVQGALAKGDKVQLVGFGTFEVRHRAPRQGRNPQDPKKVIKIPAKNVPAFRPGKALKDAVDAKAAKAAKKK
jgi:DNA-binding protein HU-beta